MDLREAASKIIDLFLTEKATESEDNDPRDLHAAAVALGRRGGKVGGKERMADLNDREREQLARKGAKARWHPRGKVKHEKRNRWAKEKDPAIDPDKEDTN